jgi:HEAT repeat protein
VNLLGLFWECGSEAAALPKKADVLKKSWEGTSVRWTCSDYTKVKPVLAVIVFLAALSPSSALCRDQDFALADLMGGFVSQGDTVYGNSQQSFAAADIARLQSADLRERANTLMMLRGPGASAAIPLLIQMLGSDTEFPAMLLLASSSLPVTQSCDRSPTFGGQAAETIARIGRGSDELLALLTNANWRIRANAARALGGLKDRRAVEPLIALLSNTSEPWQVRGNAALALELIGDARAVPPLIAALQEPNSDVRRAAVTALGLLKDPCNFQLFVKMLNAPEPEIRRGAIIGIEQIGGAAALEPLSMVALHDEDPTVRASATSVLAWIKDPRSVDTFLTALQDSNIDVRINAASGLGRLHST